MKHHISPIVLLIGSFCVACTPAEVAVVEELTQEAVILEREIFEHPSQLPIESEETAPLTEKCEYC